MMSRMDRLHPRRPIIGGKLVRNLKAKWGLVLRGLSRNRLRKLVIFVRRRKRRWRVSLSHWFKIKIKWFKVQKQAMLLSLSCHLSWFKGRKRYRLEGSWVRAKGEQRSSIRKNLARHLLSRSDQRINGSLHLIPYLKPSLQIASSLVTSLLKGSIRIK